MLATFEILADPLSVWDGAVAVACLYVAWSMLKLITIGTGQLQNGLPLARYLRHPARTLKQAAPSPLFCAKRALRLIPLAMHAIDMALLGAIGSIDCYPMSSTSRTRFAVTRPPVRFDVPNEAVHLPGHKVRRHSLKPAHQPFG